MAREEARRKIVAWRSAVLPGIVKKEDRIKIVSGVLLSVISRVTT
jgi:hypothetical protein